MFELRRVIRIVCASLLLAGLVLLPAVQSFAVPLTSSGAETLAVQQDSPAASPWQAFVAWVLDLVGVGTGGTDDTTTTTNSSGDGTEDDDGDAGGTLDPIG
jgi:hypothetical protein